MPVKIIAVAKKTKHFENRSTFANLVAYFGYLLASTTPIQNCLGCMNVLQTWLIQNEKQTFYSKLPNTVKTNLNLMLNFCQNK
jgi:hypothetical protein